MNKIFGILFVLITMLNTSRRIAADAEVPWDVVYDHATKQIVGPYIPKELCTAEASQNIMPEDAEHRALYCSKFKQFFANSHSALDLKTIDSLDIIQADGNINQGVTARIPTKTQGGTVYKNVKLVFPHNDVFQAQKSQAVIKALVEDDVLCQRILAIYDRLRNAEPTVCGLFLSQNMAKSTTKEGIRHAGPVNSLYWKGDFFKQLNQSPLAMQIGYLGEIAVPIVLLGGGILSFLYAYSKTMKDYDSWAKECARYTLVTNPKTPASAYGAAVLQGAAAGATGFLGACGGYGRVSKLNVRITEIHQKLNIVAEYVRSINELDLLIQEHDDLRNNLFFAKDLHNIATKQNCSAELTNLLTQLETDTFKSISFFSHRGRILTAYYNMQRVVDELVPALAALSELDVHSALRQLYAQLSDKKVRYAFATFVQESATPIIRATHFWNLQIDQARSITNSIAIGSPNASDVIVTGINRGGKSTIFKALALNAILAQVFGIAAAETWEQTPFAFINCYLDVVQNIQSNLSAFEAQVQRASELYHKVVALKPSEYGFLLIDEMFIGTESSAGAFVSATFAKKLANLPNISTVFISHYREVAVMGDGLPQLFQNYHVVANENADGSFTPTYSIQKGISTQNDAFFIAKKAGIM